MSISYSPAWDEQAIFTDLQTKGKTVPMETRKESLEARSMCPAQEQSDLAKVKRVSRLSARRALWVPAMVHEASGD
jgi:hypothetical protein